MNISNILRQTTKSNLYLLLESLLLNFWIDFSRPRLQDPNIEFLTYFGLGFFNAAANASEASRKNFLHLYRNGLRRVYYNDFEM